MLNLRNTFVESHPLADAFYTAIKECPFEKNKDLSAWADANILYGVVLEHFFGLNYQDIHIIDKKITIEDPDLMISEDINSYLVIELNVSILSGRVVLLAKFPVDF